MCYMHYVCKCISWISPFLQVVKFLVERNTSNALHGQVTIGTLIFQVRQVFIVMDILNWTLHVGDVLNCFLVRIVPSVYYLLCCQFWVVIVACFMEWSPWGSCKQCYFTLILNPTFFCACNHIVVLYNLRLLLLSMYLSVASVLCWSFVPRFLKLMIQLSSQVSFKHASLYYSCILKEVSMFSFAIWCMFYHKCFCFLSLVD